MITGGVNANEKCARLSRTFVRPEHRGNMAVMKPASQGKSGRLDITAQSREGLSDQEKREVERLKQRDREVRAHEQAHVAAGGTLIKRGASYEYTRGPDGRMYATGGDVEIDTSPVPGDPDATIQKAQKIKRAALAPVDPSPTDRRAAAEAGRMEAQARSEKAKESRTDEAQPRLDEAQPRLGAMQPQHNEAQPWLDEAQPRLGAMQPQHNEAQPWLDEAQPRLGAVRSRIYEARPDAYATSYGSASLTGAMLDVIA